MEAKSGDDHWSVQVYIFRWKLYEQEGKYMQQNVKGICNEDRRCSDPHGSQADRDARLQDGSSLLVADR